MKKYDITSFFSNRDAVIADAGQGGSQLGQLVIVGGEQRFAAQPGVVVQMFYDRPSDGQPVVGAVPRPISSRITSERGVA